MNYKFNESLYWLIDNDYYGIVSLGIGKKSTNISNKIGKTELLNKVFYTQFQANQSSIFDQFSAQIDVTNHQSPRKFYVVDINGNLSNFNFNDNLLQQLFSLFSLCILHISITDLLEDSLNIIQNLNQISKFNSQKKIVLFIRDYNNGPGLAQYQQLQVYKQGLFSTINEAAQLDQSLTQLQSNLQNLIHIVLIPNLKQNYTAINYTVESIQNLLSPEIDNKTNLFTKQAFYELNENFCKTFNYTNKIAPIKSAIEKFSIELNKLKEKNQQGEPIFREGCWSTNFLPARKYLNMWSTCKHEMQAQSSTAGTALILKFQEAESELKKLKLTDILLAFLNILNLDENSWYLASMECSQVISKAMESIIEMKVQNKNKEQINKQMKKNIQSQYSLSNQILIRELSHVLFGGMQQMTQLEQNYKKLLVKRQVGLLLRGEPFECLDGDNLIFASRPLKEISKYFEKKRVKSLSILGLQSTGKSTVLNYTFGTSNAHSIGQCTKGMYLSCVKVDSKDIDYLLVIDSEGLGSLEGTTMNQQLTTESDNKLILFCLSISQITIINEGSTDFQEKLASLLKNAVANLHELRRNREKPEIFFSVNKGQINDKQLQLAQTSLQTIIQDLYTQLPDAGEEIQQLQAIISNHNIFLLGQLFHENNVRFGQSQFTYKVYTNEYAKRAAMLGQKVLQQMFANQSINDQFNDWTANTNDLWQAINDSSNLYQFADLKERKDNQILTEIVNNELLKGFIFANGDDLYEKFLERSRQQGYYPKQDVEQQDYERLRARFTQNEQKLLRLFNEKLEQQPIQFSHRLREKFQGYLAGICKQKQIQSVSELKTQYQMINARYFEKIGIQAINDELSLIYEQKVNFHGMNSIQRIQQEKILRDQIAVDFEKKFNKFLQEREQDLQLDEQDANMFTSIHWGIQMKEMGFSDSIELHSLKLIINSSPNQDINDPLISQLILSIIQYLRKQSIFMNERKLASAQRPILEKLSQLKEQMIYIDINNYFNQDGTIKNSIGENKIQGLKLVQKQDQDGIAIKTAFSQLYEMVKADFQWEAMFRTLVGEILAEIGNQKFTYELVAQIFDNIITKKVWQIQDNIAPFCLQLDSIGKSIIQFFGILIIWKKLSYNTRMFQRQFIQQYWSKKSIYLQKLQDKILKNATGISKNCASKLFEILIKDYSEHYFNSAIQQALTSLQYNCDQQFSASNFQLELDREYFERPKPQEQILSYVLNPVETIKKIFNQRWQNIEQQIIQLQQNYFNSVNQKASQLVQQCADFKQKLKINSDGIKSPYLDYFEIIDKESQKQIQNIFKKIASLEDQQEFQETIFSKAMLKFFVQFLSNQKMSSISLSGPTYKFLQINIKQNYAYAPNISCTFERLDRIIEEMRGNDELPIFQVFYEQLQEESQIFLKNLQFQWQNKLGSFKDFKTRLLNKYIGCPYQCPLCLRKCDFDGDIYTQQHKQHECKYGHYIRGMQGILINNKKSLSNQTCLEKNGNDKVQIVNSNGLIEWQGTMQQLSLEDKFKDWNFQRNGNINVENNIQKMKNFWKNNENIFIDHYSKKYRIPLTKFQGGISDNAHVILELDDSGSMCEKNKWDKLAGAVNDLIRLKAGTNCRFTIRQFSHELKRINEFISVNDIQNLRLKMQGGQTDYNLPIADCLQIVNKHRGLQEPEETVIIFYTDGENNEDLNKQMIRYLLNQIPRQKRQTIQFIAICEMAHDFAYELNEIVDDFRNAGIKAQTCENIDAARLQQAGLMEFIMNDSGQENNN